MESETITGAEIVQDVPTGRDVLLATLEDGRVLAFVFDVEGHAPGLSIVGSCPRVAAAAGGYAEYRPEGFAAVDVAWADDWLPAIEAHPVGAEWLARVKRAYPEAYRSWFAQSAYEEGGEEG